MQLWHGDFPFPTQLAHLLFAAPRVHLVERHASQMVRQLRKKYILLVPSQGVGLPHLALTKLLTRMLQSNVEAARRDSRNSQSSDSFLA